MSAPDNKDPWERHYAEHGEERPRLSRLGQPVRRPAAPPPPTMENGTPAEARLLTSAELEAERKAVEGRRRREVLLLAALFAAALGVVALFAAAGELLNYFANAEPPAELVASQAWAVGARALRQFSGPECPLTLVDTGAEVVSRNGARVVRYELRATLRLRADLYAPASSPGAQPYVQMQRSVAEARELAMVHRLTGVGPAPDLPLLLAREHRAGELLVVRLPLQAERSHWSWHLSQAGGRELQPDHLLGGDRMSRYAGSATILYDTPEGRAEMRARLAAGRDYVLAVRRAAAAGGR